MNVSFTNGTGQQRQWVQNAIAACAFPLANLPVSVTFTWGEPPVANHSAFACTQNNGDGTYTITIRPDLDAPGRDPLYAGQAFYEECVVHELGHVTQFATADSGSQHDTFCGMFGAPTTDWTISEATPQGWETAVIEAVAETFKDLWFPGRKFDNRTRWRLPLDQITNFAHMFPGSVGTDLTHSPGNPWWTGTFG